MWYSDIKRNIQISSVAHSCLTLCDPMNRSTPGLPVHHQLPEFTETQRPSSQWCHPVISSSVVPFSSCPQSLPASESFPMSQLFAWGAQSIGVSYSAIKKNEIMPFAATWVDLEIIILSEVSQTKTKIIWYRLLLILKKWYKWTYIKNRNRSTDVENKLMVTKGEM